ncbi:MAG: RraA family protein [Inquilinus sp.]|nr:RraA family protein [Inquilinus sp.]
MIEDPPILTIRRRFPRPMPEQVAALAGAPTGFVVDCMDGRGALDGRIKPVGATPPAFCGVALPCHVGPGDCLAVLAALEVIRPGDVMVAATDGFAGTAVAGDRVMGMARNGAAAGFVTDGFVRDLDGIEAVGLPCFAAGITPNSPAKTGPGTIGLPVTIGGVSVAAGDIVLGDRDGVVVVPFVGIDAVIARLPTIRDAEAALDAEVAKGLLVPDAIRTLLASDAVREVD